MTEKKTPEEQPAAGWTPSADEEIVAPDGHVVLSKKDIADRKKAEKNAKT